MQNSTFETGLSFFQEHILPYGVYTLFNIKDKSVFSFTYMQLVIPKRSILNGFGDLKTKVILLVFS